MAACTVTGPADLVGAIVHRELRRGFLRKGFLVGADHGATYAAASKTLNMSEGAVRGAAHRLRKRYRQLLRSEIAQTVSAPGEIDEEIRNLFAALGL